MHQSFDSIQPLATPEAYPVELTPLDPEPAFNRDDCICKACTAMNRVWQHLYPDCSKSCDCICPGHLFEHAEAGKEVWAFINAAIGTAITAKDNDD